MQNQLSIGLAGGFSRLEKVYAPLKILAIVRTLAELNVSADSILSGTGLLQADIFNAQSKTSVSQFLTVCKNASQLSPTPNWGFLVGSQMHPTDYGMYGYALVCANSLRNACDLAVRYHVLATPVIRIEFFEDLSKAAWIFPSQKVTDLLDAEPAMFRSLVEMQIGVHVSLTKDVMGGWCSPLRVHFAFPRSEYASEIQQAIGCPVLFDQDRTELHYPVEWLDRKPQFSNPISATQVSATCSKLLEEHRWTAGLTRVVYMEITRTPGRFPSLDEVAAFLRMSARTIRRRLDQEGTSYSKLLDSIRHALAVDYLSTSLLNVDDIAEALGFSDSASFRHAFKRWTGETPAQYRIR